MHKKLVITADDYGMSEGVNEAIEKCIESGVVLSTNVMVNMDYLENAPKLKEKFPNLSLGLHYNFTAGYPLLPKDKIPSLVDKDGKFLSYTKLREKCKKGTYNLDEVKLEMKAQYDKYVSLIGEPDYWNTHQNVHVYPKLNELFIDVSKSFGIKSMRTHRRIFVKSSIGKTDKSLKWCLTNPIKKVMLNSWRKNALKKGVTSPDGILVRMYEKDKLNMGYLLNNIKWEKTSFAELIIHPSTKNDSIYFGTITDMRIKEFEVFSNSDILNMSNNAKVKITNFNG